MRKPLVGRQWFVQRAPAAGELHLEGASPVLSALLALRGVRDEGEAAAFLSPSMDDLSPAEALPDMGAAVSRLKDALSRRERIAVYGDYDADGVCATALLAEALRKRGGDVFTVIPSRHAEGYGLNEKAVHAIANQASLLITVDNGVSAHAEAELCARLRLDLIITDHHVPMETLPKALAVINPKRADVNHGGYPGLCGAGVAGRLVEAVFGREALLEVIDLVALATVADIVPLLSDNRILLAEGIRALNRDPSTRRPGITALLRSAGHGESQSVTAGDLAYKVAPRINAGGRLAVNGDAVELLLMKSAAEAEPIAARLEEINIRRKSLETEVFDDVCACVDGGGADLSRERMIVLADKRWNLGVLGIAAARVAERYGVPAALFSVEDGAATGSARGVQGMNLFEMLNANGDLFVRYGGHELAAGMTVRLSRFEEMRARFSEWLSHLPPDVFLPRAVYDLSLSPGAVDLALCDELERLEPFGAANPKPVFLARGLKASGVKRMGAEGAHVRVTLAGKSAPQVVAFGVGDRADELSGEFDASFQIGRNEWQNQVRAQITLRDFVCAPGPRLRAMDASEIARAFLRLLAYNEEISGEHTLPVRLNAREAREVIGGLLSDPRGTVFLCFSLKTAERFLRRATERGAAHRISVFSGGPPPDPRALGCVVAGPDPGAEGFRFYRKAVWLDGLSRDADTRALPVGEHIVVEDRRSLPALAADALPDIAQVRAAYRALADIKEPLGRDGLDEWLSQAADIPPAKAFVALDALERCGLIGFGDDSSLMVYPAKPCSPMQTALIARLEELSKRL